MTPDLSTSEALSYSTARIECEYKNGSKGTGTGFFFKIKEDNLNNRYVPILITNKHVIKDSVKGELIITKADSENCPLDTQHFHANIIDFESSWRNHPENEIDLCALPVAEIRKEANRREENIFYIPLDKTVIPSSQDLDKLSAMEDIVMIGYPDGIWDFVNNKPIFRKGITSIHPKYDYCGKKWTVIDMACFPGSSGSPVFIYNEAGYSDKFGNVIIGQPQVILLGVLFAGPQHSIQGEIFNNNIAITDGPKVISKIPNNLGYIIKSEKILELEALFNDPQ